jgi:glycosyltransferase involved in cell wall biosynthesis
MHIRYLLMNAYTLGGTIRTTFTSAAELAKRHDVEIVSVYKRRESERLPRPAGVRVSTRSDESPSVLRAAGGRPRWEEWARGKPSRLYPKDEGRYDNYSLLTDLRLVRYLRGLRGGILVSTRPGLNVMTARFAPRSVVTVGQDHVHLTHYKQSVRDEIARRYPRLDLVATLTTKDAEDYRRLLDDSTQITCMPNAVPDLGGIQARGDKKIVVAAGRLAPQKGFDRLIPAYAKIAADHPDWELRIFGSGPLEGKLRAMIDELGMHDRIRLMGYTSRMYDELADSAIYVMSSRYEGFPMVLLEAMGIGLPVVSFDCDNGPRDLIDHDANGLLVEDGDEAGLAAAMSALMSDEARRRSMGATARRSTAGYSAPVMAERWEAIFAELSAGKR